MKMTVDENKSICRTISKETKFYLEHIIIYFERTFLVINVIKYLIKEGSHSKQAWVDILSLLYAISLKHHEMRKHWFMGTLEQWNSVMPAGQGGDSAGTPRHMLKWITNPNINLVHGEWHMGTLEAKNLYVSLPMCHMGSDTWGHLKQWN